MIEYDAQKIYVAMYAPMDTTVVQTRPPRLKKDLIYNCKNGDLTQQFYYTMDFLEPGRIWEGLK